MAIITDFNISSIQNKADYIDFVIKTSMQNNDDTQKSKLIDMAQDILDKNRAKNKMALFDIDFNTIDIKEVKNLIKNGADVNAVNEKFATPLMKACESGRLDLATLFIIRGGDVNAYDRHGGTALMTACMTSQLDIARQLVKAGADVNAQNSVKITPLMIASHLGDVEIAKFLLKAGADISCVDLHQANAKTYAIQEKNDDIIALLDWAEKRQESGDKISHFSSVLHPVQLTYIDKQNQQE